MSSTKTFVLSSLLERGPMHGHALRQLADEERVSLWTDISVGGLYGALKRMESAGLVEVVRTEQDGRYPQRQVYGITDPGRSALAADLADTMARRRLAPDPFDLVFARSGVMDEARLRAVLTGRLEGYRADLDELRSRMRRIDPYLWLTEKLAQEHRAHRLEAEIAWHEEALAHVTDIVADQSIRQERRGNKHG